MRIFLGIALMASAAVSVAQTSFSSTDSPVAVVDGKPILASELLATSQAQILNLRKQEYEVKQRALDGVIERKLTEAEATRRGLSVNDLTQQEIDGKVAEPTDAEVQAFYFARQDQSTRPFEEVREQMRAQLKVAKRNAARDAFMSRLRAQYAVQVFLEQPRVEVGFDPVRLNGPADAPIRIVEFSDFECPYCRGVQKTIRALLDKYPGKISVAFRDFPLTSIHHNAQLAAEASRCAEEQGKFWPYHDRLFASASLEAVKLKEYASDLGMNQKKFDSCLDSGAVRMVVESDVREGRNVGVVATPSFFINGIPLAGAQPASAFEKVIEQELARSGQHVAVSR